MRKKSLLILNLIAILFLFSGCDNTSDESEVYEIRKLIDEGHFQAALDKIGDCNTSTIYSSKEECHIDRGAALYSLSGYDLLSVGKLIYKIYTDDSLDDNTKSAKITARLFASFQSDKMALGVTEYKLALIAKQKTSLVCNWLDYQYLSILEQQACISINPVLLLNVLDEGASAQNRIATDISSAIAFNDAIQGIVPISSDDLGYMVNNDFEKVSPETKDNWNAIKCLSDKATCYQNGFKKPKYLKTYTNSEGKIFKIYLLEKIDNSFKTIKLTDPKGLIALLEKNKYITINSEECSFYDFNQTLTGNNNPFCFPKPQNKTLTSELVDKINKNEDFKKSLALITTAGDTTDENEKIDNVMTDICGYPDCKVSEKDIIKYLGGQ